MSSLAEIMFDRGYKVSGSDRSLSDVTAHLSKIGVKVFEGHLAENVVGADLVVYTAAIKDDNPELINARALGIKTLERAEFMGHLLESYKCKIGVCGTHGKTTATSMLTGIFMQANKNPTALIGAKYPAIDANFLSGGNSYVLFESCEYVDSFLKFPTDIALVLNIEEDHLDYFKDLDAIKASFLKYISKGHTAVLNMDCAGCRDVANQYGGKAVMFSLIDPDADYYASISTAKGYPEFEVFEFGKKLGKIKLKVAGTHNVYDALGSLAVARVCDIPFDVIKEALQDFRGAARRFEHRGTYGFELVDDYAHHPSEIIASLKSAKQLTDGKVFCIFQPHTYTRTHKLFNEFVSALSQCDKCIMIDIYSAREPDTGIVSSKMVADIIEGAVYAPSFDAAADYVLANAQKGDIVITMGAGDVVKICDIIAKKDRH